VGKTSGTMTSWHVNLCPLKDPGSMYLCHQTFQRDSYPVFTKNENFGRTFLNLHAYENGTKL
jgi:hypothetical protein